ncbi:MAG: hypothetical protein OXK73_05765 [Rhodospirillaceae bacterium]|nr:hypothetical protein [Rhodospirillaceae bacterium]
MISDQTRGAIWQGLLDMARWSRYYDAKARRYLLHRNILRILLAFLGIATGVTLIDVIPTGFVVAPGLAILAVTIWDLVVDPGKTAAMLGSVSKDFSDLETEYRNLWESVYADRIAEDETVKRSEDIMRRASAAANRLDIHTDNKTNERCAVAAYEAEANRYAP